MYVTDYSQNTSLYAYQYVPNNEWPGPFGRRTLQLACWDTIEYQARKCRVGEIYHLRNVNIKMFAPPALSVPVLMDSNKDQQLEGRLNPDGKKVLIDT